MPDACVCGSFDGHTRTAYYTVRSKISDAYLDDRFYKVLKTQEILRERIKDRFYILYDIEISIGKRLTQNYLKSSLEYLDTVSFRTASIRTL